MKSLKGPILLLGATVIWGLAFVAQSVGMDYLGPFSFNSIRFMLGSLILIPFIDFKALKRSTTLHKKKLLISSFTAGFVLAVASNLQQIGIQFTSVGKAGFITSFYILFVPLLGLLMKKKPQRNVYIALVIAIIGFYLLCMNEKFNVTSGDILILFCALFFALHIMIIDYFSSSSDLIAFSCLQFLFCSLIGAIFMFIFEKPTFVNIFKAWLPLAYAGFFSCGIAFTLQLYGQRDVEPNTASLILSLESVFSTIFGFIILNQKLTSRELLGCLLVFISVLLVQVKSKSTNKNKRKLA